jgi:hypothetical protein
MDLESASQELYRVAPTQFTATREAMAAEAREEGQRELASSLKKLRKPSVGAWLANLLVFEQSRDVEHLVKLGAELRAPNRKLEGENIRRVSKETGDAVSTLVRDAKEKASRQGQSVSAAAAQELEGTLDAAFADPQAAERLLEGRLINGLHYSGLGFSEQTGSEPPAGAKGSSSGRSARSEADEAAARRSLEKANNEADQADTQLEKTRQAVAEGAHELTRLKSAEMQAVQRAKEAHQRASAAKEKLKKLR